MKDEDRNYSTPFWREQRDFSFESFVTEASVRLEWDFFGKWRYRRAVDTSVVSGAELGTYSAFKDYRDGFQDKKDKCPDQYTVIPGLVQFQGYPDTDLDGIEDRADSCKSVTGITQFNGP